MIIVLILINNNNKIIKTKRIEQDDKLGVIVLVGLTYTHCYDEYTAIDRLIASLVIFSKRLLVVLVVSSNHNFRKKR